MSLHSRQRRLAPHPCRARVIVFLLFCCPQGLVTRAQDSWEFSPYDIRVWVAFDPTSALTPAARQRLQTVLVQRAESEMSAVWQLTTSEPPDKLTAAMTIDLELVHGDDVQREVPSELNRDKIMFLQIVATPTEYVAKVRELDCHTRTLGPVITRVIRQSHSLATDCFTAILEAFAPLVRIERGQANRKLVRLRAGGLILDTDSPVSLQTGDLLQPIIRRNDRRGQPSNITVVPWTFLQVEQPSALSPNLWEVYVHSGWGQPFRGQRGARRQQFALGIRPTGTSTELRIDAKPLRREDTPYPLAGLEVYARRPSTDPPPRSAEEKLAAQRRNPLIFLGRTDWRGELGIGQGDTPLRMLYIKSGNTPLARLPLVPGLNRAAVARIADDDARLQAEGYLQGYEGDVMDVVGQIQLLSTLFHQRLADGKLNEAERLLEQFRALPTRIDLLRELEQQKIRQRSSPNRLVQRRIESLFASARKTVTNYLDPNLASQLLDKLNRAKQASKSDS